MTEINEETLRELSTLYRDTFEEFSENADTDERDYWQGRKDALRLAITLLNPDADFTHLIESSPGYIPVKRELYNELLADAVYNVAAIVYEVEELPRVDGRTLMNLKEFVSRYDFLAARGEFPVIDDHCLVRD